MSENVNNRLMTELIDVISDVLDVEPNEVAINAEIYKTRNWDSLGHLTIIERVESTFSVTVPDDLLADLTSVRRLEAFLRGISGGCNEE